MIYQQFWEKQRVLFHNSFSKAFPTKCLRIKLTISKYNFYFFMWSIICLATKRAREMSLVKHFAFNARRCQTVWSKLNFVMSHIRFVNVRNFSKKSQFLVEWSYANRGRYCIRSIVSFESRLEPQFAQRKGLKQLHIIFYDLFIVNNSLWNKPICICFLCEIIVLTNLMDLIMGWTIFGQTRESRKEEVLHEKCQAILIGLWKWLYGVTIFAEWVKFIGVFRIQIRKMKEMCK